MLSPLSPERPEEEGPNPLEGFSAAEVFGFIHHKGGEEGLRELLASVDDGTMTCEFLQQAANELEEARLIKPAAIVREIAATKPSGYDIDNPYDPGSDNWRYWRESWLRKRRMQSGEIEANLRAQQHRNKRKH